MIDLSFNSVNIHETKKISDIFRFYSLCLKENSSLLPEQWLENEYKRLFCRAVTRTLYRLSRRPNGAELLKIVELVYFSNSALPLKKGDLSMRVIKASLSLHYSERQIYHYLKLVRKTFCEVLYELELFG